MARVIVHGAVTEVELASDPLEGGVIATCLTGGCPWTEKFDDWGDATEYTTDHADAGREHQPKETT